MTEQLKFLAWCRTEESEKQLKDSIAVFEQSHPGIQTTVNIPLPLQMWPEIVRTALYGFDTDLGEVGSTYIESLKGMNALRPFSTAEVDLMGGEGAFVKAVYGAACDRQRQLWAIPWRTDTRAMFYRRDLFDKAGVSEEGAFQTPAKMEQTLCALQECGIESPLTIATNAPQALTTFTACWVWGAGGDFINAEGSAVTFHSAEAQKGFCDYFHLSRYLSPSTRKLDVSASDQLFCEGKAAVTYAGTWLPDFFDQVGGDQAAFVKENLGVALPPGIPIVGGTHLVIWNRSIKDRMTLDLIRFLISKETLIHYPKSISIPARLDALADEVYSSNPMYKTFNEAICIGRSVPALPLWALVEDRLGKTLHQMWETINEDPHINIENFVADSMNGLAQRLSATLS